MTTANNHPAYQIPDDPYARHRYESAMRHVAAAKRAGKSSAEIHAIFRRVMKFNPQNTESIPTDKARERYRSAAVHARRALENGKSSEEAHAIMQRILTGQSTGRGHTEA